jgi:hypothetical protein
MLGIRLQIKICGIGWNLIPMPRILYEEHMKNNIGYLKLNFKNKEHLLGNQWPLLALEKNIFVFPRTCSFLFR